MATTGATAGTATEAVKSELARAAVGRGCCRRAEVAAVLRFAGRAFTEGPRVVVAAELDTPAAAQRLRTAITEVFGGRAHLAVLAPTAEGGGQGRRWAVRVGVGGAVLARQVGLVDEQGRAVRGLPRHVVAGGVCDAEAVWRGAFMAAGTLTETGKARVSITCPGADAAMLSLALVGAARRLGVSARAREVRGIERVTVTDPDAIAALLTRLGAPVGVRVWQEARARDEAANAARTAAADKVPGGLGDANLARSAAAARDTARQLTRALEILAGDVPEHLAIAARMRIEHAEVNLEKLGSLCEPPLTKDAVAGRIRRVLALADKRAAVLGIPSATGTTGDPTVTA